MEIKSATQMAAIYGLKSSQAFNKLLAKCGVLEETPKGYVLTESLRDKGYSVVISVPFFLPSGIKCYKKKSAWTESGVSFIRHTLLHHGISPVSEQQSLFNN